MSVKNRVKKLEEVHNVEPSFDPFDPFDGRPIPDDLYEDADRYLSNRTKEGWQQLILKHPGYEDVVRDLFLL